MPKLRHRKLRKARKLLEEIPDPLSHRDRQVRGDRQARGCSTQALGSRKAEGFRNESVLRNVGPRNGVFHNEVFHNVVLRNEVFHSEVFHSEVFRSEVFHSEVVEAYNDLDGEVRSWRGVRDDEDGLEEAGGCHRDNHPRCCSRHNRNRVLGGDDEQEGLVERDDVAVDVVEDVCDVRGRRSKEGLCGESPESVCSEPEVMEVSGSEPLCNGETRTRCNSGPAYVALHGGVRVGGREVLEEDLEASRGSGRGLELRKLEGEVGQRKRGHAGVGCMPERILELVGVLRMLVLEVELHMLVLVGVLHMLVLIGVLHMLELVGVHRPALLEEDCRLEGLEVPAGEGRRV